MPPIVMLAAAAVALGSVLLVTALVGMRGQDRSVVASNLLRGHSSNLREITLARPTRERTMQPLMARLATVGRRLTPQGSVQALERKLTLAGRPAGWPLERVLATKLLLGGVGMFVAIVRIPTTTAPVAMSLIVMALLLYFSPDVVLTGRARERQRGIQHDLPDSLDQMTICMEAGLGFEASLVRTSQTNDGPLAQEIMRTLQEMQVGLTRRKALRGLADRNEVPDLRQFVTAVLQAESYGVPISRVLRDQASEARAKRRQRAEEAARKLPVKLLFPLIFFVMPPLFIILVGPAILRLIGAFSQMR